MPHKLIIVILIVTEMIKHVLIFEFPETLGCNMANNAIIVIHCFNEIRCCSCIINFSQGPEYMFTDGGRFIDQKMDEIVNCRLS